MNDKFQFARVMVSSLVGVDRSAEPSVELLKAFETFGGSLRPVIVVKGKHNEDLMDFEYRVVGNHEIAKAAQMMNAVDSRTFEYINAFILENDELVHMVKKFGL